MTALVSSGVTENKIQSLFSDIIDFISRNGTTFSKAPVYLEKNTNNYLCWSLPAPVQGGDILLLGGRYEYDRDVSLTKKTTVISSDGSSVRSGWNLPYVTW